MIVAVMLAILAFPGEPITVMRFTFETFEACEIARHDFLASSPQMTASVVLGMAGALCSEEWRV